MRLSRGILDTGMSSEMHRDGTPSTDLAKSTLESRPELRVMVYDQIFDTLAHERKVDLKRYHAAHEWSSNDFTAYRNLLLDNKQIGAEALERWQDKYTKQLYLPCMPTASPPCTAL